jgi:hypothetical protein
MRREFIMHRFMRASAVATRVASGAASACDSGAAGKNTADAAKHIGKAT